MPEQKDNMPPSFFGAIKHGLDLFVPVIKAQDSPYKGITGIIGIIIVILIIAGLVVASTFIYLAIFLTIAAVILSFALLSYSNGYYSNPLIDKSGPISYDDNKKLITEKQVLAKKNKNLLFQNNYLKIYRDLFSLLLPALKTLPEDEKKRFIESLNFQDFIIEVNQNSSTSDKIKRRIIKELLKSLGAE